MGSLDADHLGKESLVMKRRMWGWNYQVLLQVHGAKGTNCALALVQPLPRRLFGQALRVVFMSETTSPRSGKVQR